MIKSKVKLYEQDGEVRAAVKFKVSRRQSELISQGELVALLLGYRDTVLKEYTDYAAIQHIKEAIELMEKEITTK